MEMNSSAANVHPKQVQLKNWWHTWKLVTKSKDDLKAHKEMSHSVSNSPSCQNKCNGYSNLEANHVLLKQKQERLIVYSEKTSRSNEG